MAIQQWQYWIGRLQGYSGEQGVNGEAAGLGAVEATSVQEKISMAVLF